MKDRVLLVTGGGSGIGAAVAEAATAAGAQVVICGRRPDALDQVARRTGAVPRVADITVAEAVEELVAGTVEMFGRLDGLVANAGIMVPGGVLDLTPEEWESTLRTNLTSVFLLARAALPHLLTAGGAVVAVSSIAGLRASTGAAAYAASKAGLIMLTQTLATDYGPLGVRANVIAPGWVRTEMADEEMLEFGGPLGLTREQAYEEVTQVVPQRRPGTPEEVAAAVLWLLGPESSYVNGAVLTVDGGTILVDPGTLAYDFSVSLRSR